MEREGERDGERRLDRQTGETETENGSCCVWEDREFEAETDKERDMET